MSLRADEIGAAIYVVSFLKILFFALSVAIRLKILKPSDNLKNPNI